MRRSLRPYLPQEIIKRKSKGSPAEATLRAVGREWSRLRFLFRDSRIVARGYVNEGALATLLAQPFVGHDLTPVSLVRFAHLECWLQALEEFSKHKPSLVNHPRLTPLGEQRLPKYYKFHVR